MVELSVFWIQHFSISCVCEMKRLVSQFLIETSSQKTVELKFQTQEQTVGPLDMKLLIFIVLTSF